MIEKVTESIRDDIEILNLALKMLETPALKKIIVDQNGDCESQAQFFEQKKGGESCARAIREIGKRFSKIKKTHHDSSQPVSRLSGQNLDDVFIHYGSKSRFKTSVPSRRIKGKGIIAGVAVGKIMLAGQNLDGYLKDYKPRSMDEEKIIAADALIRVAENLRGSI